MTLPKVNAPCDPFEEIVSRCDNPTRRDSLVANLDTIRSKAGEIWATPRMPWFTAHGTSHSDSVVRLIGESISHLQTTPKALDCSELYVLLAACYLHDVGMQAFNLDKPIEEMTSDDHDAIRERHPTVARELIIQRTLERGRDDFDLGLPADDYLSPIALVSEAHGTATYAAALRDLISSRPQPGGSAIRGDLLGALLLMADELDIQRERATFLKEAQLSTFAMSHHLINHYVSAVHVHDAETPKKRRIRLDFLFPPDATQYSQDIRELVVKKLLRQSRLTNPVIELRTAGEMQWDSRVAVYEAEDPVNALRVPEPEVRHLLERLVLEGRFVARAAFLKELIAALVPPALDDYQPLVVEVVSPEPSEIEYGLLIHWLSILAAEHKRPFVHLAPTVLRAGHGRAGLLERATEQLAMQAPSNPRATGLRPPLLVFEGYEPADGTAEALETLMASTRGRCVLLTDRPQAVAGTSLPLLPLGADEIRDYLTTAMGYDKQSASARAASLYLATGGRPDGVLLALFAEYETSVLGGDSE